MDCSKLGINFSKRKLYKLNSIKKIFKNIGDNNMKKLTDIQRTTIDFLLTQIEVAIEEKDLKGEILYENTYITFIGGLENLGYRVNGHSTPLRKYILIKDRKRAPEYSEV